MQVNNEIYETKGHGWWADDAAFGFSSLRLCLNPVRYGYFKRKMSQLQLPGKTVLDVGCGGGYLAEAFAGDGFMVAGVDPAARSIEAAQKHASEKGLTIDYRLGRGEALPFPDGCFEVVACCDVLEHVDDLDKTVSEVARMLKPGGVFFYETVNRTWLSKLVLIKIWQDWRITRLCDPNTHVWERFIKPAELDELMRSHCLINQERKGISSKNRNPIATLWTLRSIAKGGVRSEDLPDRLGLCEADNLSLNYMGYAIKSPAEPGRRGGATFSPAHCPRRRKVRTMNEPNKKLNVRTFVAPMIGFCGIGLPVTGVVNHLNEFSPVSVEGHAWHSSHNVLGVLFVVFSIWHIVLNRRPLWNYIRSKASGVPSVSREFVLAGIIVASLLVVFVGHEFLAHGR